jgi:LmbE family N-acetylglucosaminyl deacetylase
MTLKSGRKLAVVGALSILAISSLALHAAAADGDLAPPRTAHDERYKADILLVIAHPDDETGDVATYLSRSIFDEHRKVAVVCITRGDAGGNSVGGTRQAALGAQREIEARQALAFLGIKNVWFLDAHDTPEQDVLSSLEHWDHGSVLGQVVRLVRMTQPAVVITWLPNAVAGENHADHQAASVVATEAFDLAGDPTAFPEQVADVQKDLRINAEGLRPWQPQKLYYYTDAFDASGYWLSTPVPSSPFRKNFLDGAGPMYAATDVSGSRHLSYARLSAEETSFYLTQDGGVGQKALESGSFKDFEYPMRFIFGKSLVGGTMTGDIFEGVTAVEIPFSRAPGFRADIARNKPVDLGGPWGFYREFWKAHGVEHIAKLLPVPEMRCKAGANVHIPMVLRNEGTVDQEFRLHAELPDDWSDRTRNQTYRVPAGGSYSLEAIIEVPQSESSGWKEVTWNAESNRKQIGSVKVHLLVMRAEAQ